MFQNTQKAKAITSDFKMFQITALHPKANKGSPFWAALQASSTQQIFSTKIFTWKFLGNSCMQYSAAETSTEQWYFL